MGHLVEVLAGLGVFVAGLLVRFALLLLVLAVLAIPVFLILLAIRGYGLARGRAIGLTRVDGLYWRPDFYMRLLYGERARSWLREEGARLAQFLETELGVAAADGGEFLFPAPSFLSDAQWEALTGAFLKAGRFSKPDQESR
jgi:hypothetical protein